MQVTAAVSRAVEELGSVDILVNDAGTLDHVGQFDRRPELWERDLRVDLARELQLRAGRLARHTEHNRRRIVNMASVSGHIPGGFEPGLVLDDEGQRILG